MEDIEPYQEAAKIVVPQNFTARQRSKTSLRLKYEAESAVLRKEIGSLEDVRIKLGLSRRRICQVLMVDPSAWTRWTTGKSDAPPHVYQALRWYLDSKSHGVSKLEGYWEELKTANRDLHDKVTRLQTQHKRMKIYFLVFLTLGCLVLTWLIWQMLHPGDATYF